MRKNSLYFLLLSLILILALTACEFPLSAAQASENMLPDIEKQPDSPQASKTDPTTMPEPTSEEIALEMDVSSTEEPNADPTEEPTVEPTEEPTEAVGSINPLTGMPVDNPDYLGLPPALVSISNFPASGRPQAGLSFSPITFEIAIGEGMTRFLAMFYGQFPGTVSGQTEGDPPIIGPIRSGRLSYEDIRATYSGFLVMASAWEGVSTNLNSATSVYGSNAADINSATVSSDRLLEIARSEAQGYPGSNFSLEGMTFSQTPPENGMAADQAWVFYSDLNQVQWRYDQELGAYVRYDIKTDGSREFVMATDRITGEPISKENMIVIFAPHDYKAPTLIDIPLTNQPPTKALLFRDGQVYEIFWTTRFGEYEKETGLLRPMRFVDANGDPVALKPGQTWISVVSLQSYYVESAVKDLPFYPIVEEEGTGLWLIRYKGLY
jgi:hypothetical protein